MWHASSIGIGIGIAVSVSVSVSVLGEERKETHWAGDAPSTQTQSAIHRLLAWTLERRRASGGRHHHPRRRLGGNLDGVEGVGRAQRVARGAGARHWGWHDERLRLCRWHVEQVVGRVVVVGGGGDGATAVGGGGQPGSGRSHEWLGKAARGSGQPHKYCQPPTMTERAVRVCSWRPWRPAADE